MNREQFEAVKHLENNFKTAIESNYTRALSKRDRNTLGDLYRKLAKEPVVLNLNCSGCVVTALQIVGADYFKYKKKDGNRRTDTVEEGPDNRVDC